MNDDTAWSSLLDPPYSRTLLAALHAGALDDALAAALWPRVRSDQDATSVIDALDTTVRQLSTAPAPAVPIPAHVAARIDASLAAVASLPPAGTVGDLAVGDLAVGDLAAARVRRRRRGRYVGAGLVAAAAAVAAVVSLNVALGPSDVAGTPQAGPPAAVPSAPLATPAPLDLGSGTVGPRALAVLGKQDLGPLSDKSVLAGCLRANGFPSSATVVGASEVLLDGRRGILLLLPSGRVAVFTALVVGPECSANNPATRSQVEIGPR